ncbi:MAG: hypothetical protein LQ341_003480 [Variospora aurantia]|nr:MAG: hypothetical protein LQ341_003480 [Variospora aurantia]
MASGHGSLEDVLAGWDESKGKRPHLVYTVTIAAGFVQPMMIMGPVNRNGRGGGRDDLGWKTDGWVWWFEGLRGNYERRMQTMCTIFDDGKQLVKT